MRRLALDTDDVWQAFVLGFDDRDVLGLARKEQPYRRRSRRWAWRCGWELANLVTCTLARYTRRPWR